MQRKRVAGCLVGFFGSRVVWLACVVCEWEQVAVLFFSLSCGRRHHARRDWGLQLNSEHRPPDAPLIRFFCRPPMNGPVKGIDDGSREHVQVSFKKGGMMYTSAHTYFFLCTSAQSPLQNNKERLFDLICALGKKNSSFSAHDHRTCCLDRTRSGGSGRDPAAAGPIDFPASYDGATAGIEPCRLAPPAACCVHHHLPVSSSTPLLRIYRCIYSLSMSSAYTEGQGGRCQTKHLLIVCRCDGPAARGVTTI